jgi:hypothetical protein
MKAYESIRCFRSMLRLPLCSAPVNTSVFGWAPVTLGDGKSQTQCQFRPTLGLLCKDGIVLKRVGSLTTWLSRHAVSGRLVGGVASYETAEWP